MDIVPLDPDAFDAIDEAATVIKRGVDDDAGGEGKSEEVGDGVGGREVEWGVELVGGDVEGVVCFEDAFDVVGFTETIIGNIGGNGKVG